MPLTRRTVLAATAAALLPSVTLADDAKRAVVTPELIDDLLPNPGTGWQTMHWFADRDKNLAGLPSTCAYFRFYWNEIESDDRQVNFAKLDDLFVRARNAGQRIALRVMCVGGGSYAAVPAHLKQSGCKGAEYQSDGKGPVHWTPDMDDPIFQREHFRLIDALGARYDAHPDFDLLDIGSVGLWGEWHMSGTRVPMPSQQTRNAIIDRWCAAFPRSPKVMLIGDVEGLKHAFAKGAGWRADCIGDLGGFSKKWNHMENLYPKNLADSGAADVWKTAPVAYESCWDMRKWVAEGWDVRRVFDYALDTHASYLNNKSTPIPDGTRPEVERFLRKLGYRLALRRADHPTTLATGAALPLTLTWENQGVAPPYRDYLVAARLTDDAGTARVIVGKTSVKGMLPGPHETTDTLPLPSDLKPGRYTVALGVVTPDTTTPALRLAIKGRDPTGWYPLSTLTLS